MKNFLNTLIFFGFIYSLNGWFMQLLPEIYGNMDNRGKGLIFLLSPLMIFVNITILFFKYILEPVCNFLGSFI